MRKRRPLERAVEKFAELILDTVEKNLVNIFIYLNRIDKLYIKLIGRYDDYPLCKEIKCLCPVIATPDSYYVEGANCCLVMYVATNKYSFVILRDRDDPPKYIETSDAMDIVPEELKEYIVFNLEKFD